MIIRVAYQDGEAVYVEILFRLLGSNAEKSFRRVDLKSANDPNRLFGLKTASKISDLREEICRGTEQAREQYEALLSSNKDSLNKNGLGRWR